MATEITLRDSTPQRIMANLPKRPVCPICAGGGYLANGPLPKPLTAAALCSNVIPCECPAGVTIRELQAEMCNPTLEQRMPAGITESRNA